MVEPAIPTASVTIDRDLTRLHRASIGYAAIEDDADVGIVGELLHEKLEQLTMGSTDDEDVACHDPPDKRAFARHETFSLQFFDRRSRIERRQEQCQTVSHPLTGCDALSACAGLKARQ
jgi:hypothetical protein